jgi:hypothetical protein
MARPRNHIGRSTPEPAGIAMRTLRRFDAARVERRSAMYNSGCHSFVGRQMIGRSVRVRQRLGFSAVR